MIAEFDFQVHPNRRDQTPILGQQVSELTDQQRWHLLQWLTGYTPAAIHTALEALRAREQVAA